MRLLNWVLTTAFTILVFSSRSHSATIIGTVKGPEGTGFRAAFVAAQNLKTKISITVLSGPQGHYRIESLQPGEYRLSIRAVGYKAEPHEGVNLTATRRASVDFSLEEAPVLWSDISGYQGKRLFPHGQEYNVLIQQCSTCHLFQNRMVPLGLDVNGWKSRIDFMNALGVAKIQEPQLSNLAIYLSNLFGPHSVLPKSPEESPKYRGTVRSFSDDSLNIVYVQYDMPGPNRMPFSAAPDKDGYLWIPNNGPANKITRLDPNTGEMQDFSVPNAGPAHIHSAVPAPDGTVWLAEQGSNKVGKWDPTTQQVTEYQDQPSRLEGGSKHTVRIDSGGNVWISGSPLARFDPRTRQFKHFDEVSKPYGAAYDVKPDKNGDVWFTYPSQNKIGRVDGKTLKVSMWVMPTANSYPRRMEISPDGMVWVGESGFPFSVGKFARFDPKTETFKEYPLPGPDPSPYAMGFDTDGYLWYNSHYMDIVARFDPKTGKVIEYPFPNSEITMREFFRDAHGRLWYGSSSNNRVGYFYIANRPKTSTSK